MRDEGARPLPDPQALIRLSASAPEFLATFSTLCQISHAAMNLWDRNRERRRERILDSAAQIIARDGLAGLSMRKLGRAAEVSVATIYSTCGARDEIVWAVIRKRFSQLGAAVSQVPSDQPIKRMRSIVSATARRLGEETETNRAVLLAAFELGPGSGSPELFVGDAFAEAIREAIESGQLTDTLDPDVLSGHILRTYLQAMMAWSRGFVSTAGFEALAIYSLDVSLLAVATRTTRTKLLAEIRRLEPHILKGQKALTGQRAAAESA